MKPLSRLVYTILALAIVLYIAFFVGRRTAPRPPAVWLSEVNLAVSGHKQPLLTIPVKCLNGKDLGFIQIDINLKNNKWRVVRNDPGEYPSCD